MTPPVHIPDTRIQRANPFTHLIPSFMAVTLLLTSLATTGCDFVDSNTGKTVSPGPRWIAPIGNPEVLPMDHVVEWPIEEAGLVSRLRGTWELVSADIQVLPEDIQRPRITFKGDDIFTGYAKCYNFSGRYCAGSDGLLTVTDFRYNQKFCVEEHDSIRKALFEGLQEATDFRFETGTLWIMSGRGKRARVFIFEHKETDPV